MEVVKGWHSKFCPDSSFSYATTTYCSGQRRDPILSRTCKLTRLSRKIIYFWPPGCNSSADKPFWDIYKLYVSDCWLLCKGSGRKVKLLELADAVERGHGCPCNCVKKESSPLLRSNAAFGSITLAFIEHPTTLVSLKPGYKPREFSPCT